MDCLCDADLARVGYERPKFRAERKAPLDTLGILAVTSRGPEPTHVGVGATSGWRRATSGARTSSSTPRYVFYLCDNAVDATPSAPRPSTRRGATPSPRRRHLGDLEASIKRGRAEAKRRKELAALDRSDTESTASEASIINDAKVECFAAALMNYCW